MNKHTLYINAYRTLYKFLEKSVSNRCPPSSWQLLSMRRQSTAAVAMCVILLDRAKAFWVLRRERGRAVMMGVGVWQWRGTGGGRGRVRGGQVGGVWGVESSPDLLGILPFDHLGNRSTDDIQERFDVKIVGSLWQCERIFMNSRPISIKLHGKFCWGEHRATFFPSLLLCTLELRLFAGTNFSRFLKI